MKQTSPHRILLVDNLMIRRYGNLRMGPGRKLMCGAIRNGWRICEFSDRDMARLLAPLGIRAWGGRIANSKLLLTARNFRPDIMLLGHCDYITNETLNAIREALPGIRIAHFNVDPLWQERTRAQMADRMHSCDALFATTAGNVLKTWTTGENVVAYMPNPSDPSMENQDNGLKHAFARDLFFAGNPRAGDPRWNLLHDLLPCLKPALDLGGRLRGRSRNKQDVPESQSAGRGEVVFLRPHRASDGLWHSHVPVGEERDAAFLLGQGDGVVRRGG